MKIFFFSKKFMTDIGNVNRGKNRQELFECFLNEIFIEKKHFLFNIVFLSSKSAMSLS